MERRRQERDRSSSGGTTRCKKVVRKLSFVPPRPDSSRAARFPLKPGLLPEGVELGNDPGATLTDPLKGRA